MTIQYKYIYTISFLGIAILVHIKYYLGLSLCCQMDSAQGMRPNHVMIKCNNIC